MTPSGEKPREPGDGYKSYSDLNFHRKMSRIIKLHSENRADVREVARQAIDWDGIASIVDAGCGYGWFEEPLERRFRMIAGIDMLEENREPFMTTAARHADEVSFHRLHLPAPIPLPSSSFDLVVACYSLYFFPDALPEICRLLRPGGVGCFVTHSEAMLGEGEEFFHFRELRKLIERFSAENGGALLRSCFAEVRYIDYTNHLTFSADDSEDLGAYIMFKRDFIARDADPEAVKGRMLAELKARGQLRFNKNDRIFIGRR